MRDKNSRQAQIERLIELTNELEKRDLALTQESKRLEQLREALDKRERELSAAEARRRAQGENAGLHTPPPLVAPQSVKPAEKPQAAPAAQANAPVRAVPEISAQAATEISDILKSISWDYSNSVHQISSQMSTVTAAMMCAAVTCVLENRGFDAKAVFMEEMEKMLQGGGPGGACAATAGHTRPDAEPVPGPQATDRQADTAEGEGLAVPQPAGDGALRIASAAEFEKLGEYGLRNDEKLVRVEVPEGVEQLPGGFFYGCRNLEEVALPATLRGIGPYAFYGCEKLRVVRIGENAALREIGEYAFAMCSALQTFEVPAAVETLGTSVFRFCSSLKKLKFAKDGSLRRIGSHLLQNCTALEKLRLPDGITVIPTSMFYGCSVIKKVVARGVDTIEDYAFYGNLALRSVRIRTKKKIAEQAFEGCDPELEIEYLNY